MEPTGTVITSISLRIELWNEIQKVINDEDMSFSRFIQSSARLKLKSMKIQRVREVFDILDDNEIELLRKEIIKRQKKAGK